MNLTPLRAPRLACLAALTLLAGCTSDDDAATTTTPPTTNPGSFTDVLAGQGLTTLQTALAAAGLDTALESGGPYTLLAPSEAAFAALPPGVLADLLLPQNQQTLQDLLSYHVLPGNLGAGAIAGLGSAMSLLGPDVQIDGLGPDLYVNEARVTTADIAASNGVVHVIDAVLMQPQSVLDTLQARGFTTLVAAVQAAGLTGALNGGNFTVFAPTDAAFAALPPGVLSDLLLPQNQAQLVSLLQYHLVPGTRKASELFTESSVQSLEGPLHFIGFDNGIPTTNETPIEAFNIPATDGVVHAVSSVLTVPEDMLATLQGGNFGTLTNALQVAGLSSVFQGPGPLTLFAPTDAAFAALDPAALSALLNDPPALAAVLQYHVLGSAQQARQIRLEPTVTTLQGDVLQIDPLGGFITLNGVADVRVPDGFASNGIVHEIDAVLLPPTP